MSAGRSIQKSDQSQSTKTIGLIMPEVIERFSAQTLSAIETALFTHGYRLVLRQSQHSLGMEEQAIRTMLQDGVHGLIVFPVDNQVYNEEILRLTLDNFPLVLIDRYLKGIETSAVYSDNLQAGYDLTTLLLSKKHRKIGVISAPNFNTVSVEERIKGYENALTEAGVPIDRSLWFTEILVDNPVERATAFLQANPDMTGLFAMNAYAGRIAT